MLGANPEELRGLAGAVEARAHEADEAERRCSSEVAELRWLGPDAERFEREWVEISGPSITALSERLRACSEELRRQADEQDACSSTKGGSGGGGLDQAMGFVTSPEDPGPLRPIEPGAGETQAVREAPTPEAARDAWAAMSPSERLWVLNNDPDLVRNRDGIPLNDRSAANQAAAQRMLDDPASQLSPERRAVLESIARGETRAVYLDPQNGDIIAMYGTPGPNTKRVVIHQPQTGGKFEDIPNGEHLNIPKDLAAKDPDTVVLINQKGPVAQSIADVPGLNGAGPPFANDPAAYNEAGRQLAEFQQSGVATDPHLGRPEVKQVGMGYSYGNSVTTASEMQGAHYDQVISISGANAPSGWQAQSGTKYDNYQYDNDMLNMANDLPFRQETGAFPGIDPDHDPSWRTHNYGNVEGDPDWLRNGDVAHSPQANAHRQAAQLNDANARLVNDLRTQVNSPK